MGTFLPTPAAPGETALVRSVYERAGANLLWSVRGRTSAQADEFERALHTVEARGLLAADYLVDLIDAAGERLGSQGTAEDSERFDALVTRAAVRLVWHLHYGRIDPHAAGFELAAARTDLDVAATVVGLASARNVADALLAVEPRFSHYALLKDALSRYRSLGADLSLTQLPGIGKRRIRVGEPYNGATALRRLLVAEGDLGENDSEGAAGVTTLDAALSAALGRFQDRHGLSPDGALGAATLAALTTPIASRVRQIELTLERWRWLPEFYAPPIIVNIPEFRLFAFSTTSDRVASILQMPVIVGQAYVAKRTPVFVGELKYVVFRPYWDVPRSIMVRELLPAIRSDANYLERHHFEIVEGAGDDANVVEATPEALTALAAGRLRLRQQPGDENALGLIKFLFPNSHNVYMHSTPAHQLFLASRRAFSHGCIRVSDPVALATYVLRNAPGGWDSRQIDEAMHASNPIRVELHEPIHVMILYGTAMATEAGPVQFFEDIYGHDRKLEALLGLRPVNSSGRTR